jgi:regulator of replication initiation timing
LQQKWLEDFKIAIIEKNFEKIENLLEEMPEIKSIGDLKTSVALINEAKKLLASEQSRLKENMAKIQKSKKFLQTREEHTFSKSC